MWAWDPGHEDLTDLSRPAAYTGASMRRPLRPKRPGALLVMCKPRLVAAFAVLAASAAFGQGELELDLSAPPDFESVVVLPPVQKVTSKQGGFVGFDAKKTKLKWDTAGHKRLVDALTKALGGKVIPAEATVGALGRAGVTPANAFEPEAQSKLARALNVAWVVSFDFNATGSLVGSIADFEGQSAGEKSYVTKAAGLKQPVADDMAGFLAKQLKALAKARADAQAAAIAAAKPRPVEQEVDQELVAAAAAAAAAAEARQRAPSPFAPSPGAPRLSVAVGPGVATRGLAVGGEASAALAELRSGAVVGLGFAVQVRPLNFFEKTKGRRWSDLELELHYRRAFTRAQGTAGSVDGETCAMTEDDVQARGTWRYRFSDHPYVPSVGVGGGFSQEQTQFSCSLPLVSAVYRGADVQLRVRQPLFRDVLALDLAVGPRVLFGGPDAQPGFSLAGEAWVEARPVSFLFARGGARLSRLTASTAGLEVVDTRGFFALELGAFF